MTTQLMPRREALLKLLRLEPMTRDEVYHCCGWPWDEVDQLLKALLRDGLVQRYKSIQRVLHIAVDR